MKKDRTVTLSGPGGDTTWEEPRLRAALLKAGFAYRRDGIVAADPLRDGCERFLDKETDEDVITLCEIADISAAHAQAVLRVHDGVAAA